ncbi:MAG: hypothetical protein VX777_09590 [Chlamydiota bacterium]|nr:hypothetical protein [Chlamydiota bacterium]
MNSITATPYNFEQLSLADRLTELKSDKELQPTLEYFSKFWKITPPDNNEENINKIRSLYIDLEDDLQNSFLCGACTNDTSYLLFQKKKNVTLITYNDNNDEIEQTVLEPVKGNYENTLAEKLTTVHENKYASSAWSTVYYSKLVSLGKKIDFMHRTPGRVVKEKKLEGNFPNDEVSSTLKMNNQNIPTIFRSALTKSKQKSARN